jgi:hypothetical protein
MSSAIAAADRRRLLVPLLLGAWAAAIAVAPGTGMKLALVAPLVLVLLGVWTLENAPRWIACFFAAALLLPPLPIAWGDTGPHPSLVFAALGLAAGILWLSRWKIEGTRLNGALFLFLVVLLGSTASAAFYSGAAIAAGSAARVGLFAISAYVFWFTAYGPGASSDGWRRIRTLYWMAAASALFACIDFYYQFPAPAGFASQFVWLDSGVYRRAQGVFYEASTLGNVCAFFLVMIAVSLTRSPREAPVGRKALAVGGLALLGALVLSYSRSSLLSVLTALAVLGWMNRKRVRIGRTAGLVVGGIAVAALIAGKLSPEFFEHYWLRVVSSAEFLTNSREAVLSGRLENWRVLIDWMAAHPWQVWVGIGYKTLPYTSYLGAPIVGDNMYLTMLVETGVLGLAALLWLNTGILRAAAHAARAADPTRSFLGTWMLCFWSGQMVQMLSADVLTFWRVLPIYFWVLALAVRV